MRLACRDTWRLPAIATTLAIVVACSGSTEPGGRLATGRYVYVSTVPSLAFGGAIINSQYVGTLTLTFVSADSIAGSWDVSGFQTRTNKGAKDGDAYVLWSYASGDNKYQPAGTVILHRIAPNLGCIAQYFPASVAGSCTLAKQ